MRTYEWFVFPIDANTNRVISETWPMLSFYEAVLCDDGVRRSMWLMESYEQITQLVASKEQRKLLFHVYNRAAPHLTARSWKFAGKKSTAKKPVPAKTADVPF